jgi:hypothetical protein
MNKKLLMPFFWIGMPLGLFTTVMNVLLVRAGITWLGSDTEGFQSIARFMGWCMFCSIPTIVAIIWFIF